MDADGPPDLRFPDEVCDISFFPTQDVIAVGLISGQVGIYSYQRGAWKNAVTLKRHHEGAVWAVEFTEDGSRLFTGSSDNSIKSLDPAGRPAWCKAGAHAQSISVIRPLGVSGLIVSGDDDGHVRVWDTRLDPGAPGSSAACVAAFHHHTDAVSDIVIDRAREQMLSAGGDGTLCVYDLRKGAFMVRSEEDEHEYLSLCHIKDGKEVVVGTQSGLLQVWSWGHWTFEKEEDFAHEPDYFRGHPDSISSMLKVDEDTIVTGSEDGVLRLVTIHPNKLVGVLGEHGDFSIERLQWSHDRKFIGSVSHDCLIKFWDVSYLWEGDEETKGVAGRSKFVDLPALGMPVAEGDDDEDFEDDDDDDDDEDFDDDEEEDEGGVAAGGAGQTGGGGGAMDDDEEEDEEEEPVRRRAPKKTKPAGGRGGGASFGGGKKRGGGGGAAGGGAGGGFFSGLA